jgi:SOS-response transcriptional repressor LexA
MQILTEKQQQIYDYIASCPICPTIAEVADAAGISVNCAREHMLRMKNKGVITWDERKSRTIRIVK